ncbi:MAG: hypothetical protein QM778_36840 [Myxococcales bacterium]
MKGPEEKQATPPLTGALGKRELLVRLVLAEVIAKPGEGPLAPRFARPLPRRATGEGGKGEAP